MKTICSLVIAIAGAFVSTAAIMAVERPNLTGQVTSDDQMPLSKATVFIYTAGPRTGSASLCPSCYLDCRKKAQTDAEGRFKIDALDPTLLFRVLVVARDHEAKFVSKVDPATKPLHVVMKKLDEAVIQSRPHVEGVVLNYDGVALAGAVIGPEGVERNNGTQWGGTDAFVDPVAVTDDRGHFVLFFTNGVRKIHAMVEAPGVAKRWVTLQPGRDHLIRMQEGVAISGKLVRDGKPVSDAVVALSTVERTCGLFLHDFEAITDAKGEFTIVNVTPDNEYHLFTKMESLRDRGALPLKTLKSGVTGTVTKLGDLPLATGYRVAGRIVLSDGKNVPPKTRLHLGRDDAWDYTDLELGPGGEFVFHGVPQETIDLNVRVKGYKFSKKNPSLDRYNGGITGRVENDITDLSLVMEPGEHRYKPDDDSASDSESNPGNKPLRSARF